MLSKKMQTALNNQIQAEFYSAYLYLSMSAYYSKQSLNGIANWLKVQYEEEREHALKIYDYIIERGSEVELKDIKVVKSDFGTPLQTFEQVLEHEKHVTSLINKLYQLALSEKDYATQIFLEWFITEQVEEEASVEDIIEKMKRIPENSAALFYFDDILGKREE